MKSRRANYAVRKEKNNDAEMHNAIMHNKNTNVIMCVVWCTHEAKQVCM